MPLLARILAARAAPRLAAVAVALAAVCFAAAAATAFDAAALADLETDAASAWPRELRELPLPDETAADARAAPLAAARDRELPFEAMSAFYALFMREC